VTGTTKQITGLEGTYLRETGEYDPTWSPNGKLVAHDVVSSDSHTINITDVKTGVSTVLHGTEDGGNDAAWSPNGKWIAFDRRWFGEPNIYIVPAGGGTRLLVVENAFTASWAPSGKRIAFQSPDGSIRTAPVDGGKGGETIVATDNCSTPAWSPDGNWIAYSKDGDIWKVQVNALGVRKGEPIQLTSGPFGDGKPTWSPDSQTITYDSNFGQDSDLWSIPAAGGTPTWLTGAPVFGDYGPANARNSATIAYASPSPDGQTARTWVAAYTYNAGTWDVGTHTYQFWAEGSPGNDERSFEVSTGAPLYPGLALLRPAAVRAQTLEGCANVDAINPEQETQFHVGWTFDGLYADARVYFANLMAQVRWDAEAPVNMQGHLIFPLTSSVDWFGYTCTFTAP
jgi:Tol biopolymer transport system component